MPMQTEQKETYHAQLTPRQGTVQFNINISPELDTRIRTHILKTGQTKREFLQTILESYLSGVGG